MKTQIERRIARLETPECDGSSDCFSEIARNIWPDQPISDGTAFLKIWTAISDGSIPECSR